jgi:hypothetical protein
MKETIMRKHSVFVMALCIAESSTLSATECERVPMDKRKWQTEEVVSGKVQTADAVFIGKVVSTAALHDNKCVATIAPREIYKGNPGKEVVSTQYDNRFPGADENKCSSKNWVQAGKSYLFYLSSVSNQQGSPTWFFPFCSLDSYVLVGSARKEMAIVMRISRT